MTREVRLPSYRELPAGPSGGRTAWGLFGAEDNLGMANLLTPERTAAAAKLATSGRVFPLNAPLGAFDPPLASSRASYSHRRVKIERPGVIGLDDVLDDFNPQLSSQWDSLAHASYDGEYFYNGVHDDEVAGGRNTIDHLARRGIAARGVLVDLSAQGSIDFTTPTSFSVVDLEEALGSQGVEAREGDLVMFYTGFAEYFLGMDPDQRSDFVKELCAPGLEHTEAIAEYLWDLHPFALVSDTFAVEVWPPDRSPEAAPFGFLHQTLLGAFGIWLGELWWLADLAADCRADGVYEFLVTSAPLHLPAGVSSTANALAIK